MSHSPEINISSEMANSFLAQGDLSSADDICKQFQGIPLNFPLVVGSEFRGHFKFYGDNELWSLELEYITETTWIGDSEPDASGPALSAPLDD